MILTIPLKLFSLDDVTPCVFFNDFLVNCRTDHFPVFEGDTYNDLLVKCGIKCHISPVYLPMFAIWNPSDKSWKNMNRGIDITEKFLEFRIRFIVKLEAQIAGERKIAKRWSLPGEQITRCMDSTVIAYYYHQLRDDYLLDKLTLNTGDQSQTDILLSAFEIAVYDILCMSKAANVNINAVKHQIKIKKLLPKSCFRSFRQAEIKRKFNQHWKQFLSSAQNWEENHHRLVFYHQRYISNLDEFLVSHGTESYKLAMNGYVTVSADLGITFHRNSDDDDEITEHWGEFWELTDMSLNFQNSMVTLGKFDGSVKKFEMKSIYETENLASCINGYYNLLVDAHHYLCMEVTSPMLIEHLILGCHGPITPSFAEESLRKREAEGVVEVGDCILRQSHDTHGEYYVDTVFDHSPLQIRNFKLNRNPSGQLGIFGLEHSYKYKHISQLLNSCKDGRFDEVEVPIKPNKIVFPQSKQRNNLIVNLCCNQENRETDFYNVRGIVPTTVLIRLEDYSHVRYLGSSHFTDVKRYTKRGETDKYIVFKTIIDQDINTADSKALNDHINISLQESTAILNRLEHNHIIQHIGMTLNNMLAFEYLRFGSITSYLENVQKSELSHNPTWLLQVILQITRACHYLEELGFAHGNLQGKNILLQNDYPQPHIKLADAGVLTRIRTSEVSDTCKRLFVEARLTSPWLAYEFCDIDDSPNFNKYPTIAGDKWSFATTLCEILNFGRITVDPMNGNEMTEKMKTFYRNGTLNQCLCIPELITNNAKINNLICSCWSKNPSERPSFHNILRELGSTIASDHALSPLPAQPICDMIVEIEHDLPTYEDEKLTCRRSLGEGHFGCVELCAYDQYRNNNFEFVAVKRSKLPMNKRLQEFTQEIETMKKLNHPYVVRLLGVATPSNRIVMEYLKNGSLVDNLREKKRTGRTLPMSTLLQFSSQIAEGMVALQQKRLIHRDLALRNILLGNDLDHPRIKISDFGLSRFLGEDADAYMGNLIDFPAKWYPPECLCKEGIGFQFESDVWSYGVTLWEMFSYGDKPVYQTCPEIRYREQLQDLLNCLINDERLQKPRDCPVEVYELMLQCWAYAPSDRLSFVEIKNKLDDLFPHADQLPL
uniref:tyrosine-protein kinase JAK2-like isoform X1 n=2 Tax=Styela clava TaxID=7725 RepID=UPI00193AA71A|nr:tyrosine-protein kinase JAK2-like isoform X1 [Styela clava]